MDAGPEEQANQARGFKATIANPNVSDEAKQNAKQALGQSELQDAGKVAEQNEVGKNPGNVAGGLKAAINNPNNTEDGKQAAQEKLDQMK